MSRRSPGLPMPERRSLYLLGRSGRAGREFNPFLASFSGMGGALGNDDDDSIVLGGLSLRGGGFVIRDSLLGSGATRGFRGADDSFESDAPEVLFAGAGGATDDAEFFASLTSPSSTSEALVES